MLISSESPLQRLQDKHTERAGVELYVKRDDLLHPQVSGNKWRKLQPNIAYALQNGYKGILSMAGAYSNHLYALAAACEGSGLSCAVYIRGEAPKKPGFTLSYAQSKGVDCIWTTRETYRKYRINGLAEALDHQKLAKYYFVPEGGSNSLGITGIAQLVQEVPFEPDYWVCALGTGGTAAGLLKGSGAKVLAVSALNAGEAPIQWVKEYVGSLDVAKRLILRTEYSVSGYASINETLVDFMNKMYHEHGLLLDPIYTAKALYGCFEMIKNNYWSAGAKLVFVHTGGLQGVWGLEKKLIQNGLDSSFFEHIPL
jgi:1-aminocyclopropane-1-carboxylate deaminase/D-cysteine desulfhydrase-like pyridoxal-dependent ACC family enzyme